MIRSISRSTFRGVADAIDLDAGKRWIRGPLVFTETDRPLIYASRPDGHMGWFPVEAATAGQCTGYADENGTLIFEGDVVEDSSRRRYAVVFTDGAFRIVTAREKAFIDKGLHPYDNDYKYPTVLAEVMDGTPLKVVGNVYDDPRLLDGGIL